MIFIGNLYFLTEIYHTVSYQINYAVNSRLRSFFSVDLDSGRIFVDYTTDEVLDRDGDEPTHRIFLNLIDNFYSAGGMFFLKLLLCGDGFEADFPTAKC